MRIVFHIGLHKTATTWLQSQYFAVHPEIALVANWRHPWEDDFLREIIATSDRRFDADRARKILAYRVSDAEQRGKAVAVVSAERLSGHPISGGYDTFRIAERIKAIAPNAQVLALVRNQRDLLRSVYQQLVNEGYPGDCRSLIEQRPWKSVGFSFEIYEFDLLLEKYLSLFSEDRVRFMKFEHFRQAHPEFMSALSCYLGVSPSTPIGDNSLPVNASMPLNRFAALRIVNHLRRTEINPFPMINLPFARSLVGAISRLVSTKAVNCDDLDKIIADYYKGSNSRFKEMSGLDMDP